MGLQTDPNARWRSSTLASIAIKHVGFGDIERGREEAIPTDDAGISDASIKRWVDASNGRHIDEDVARVALVQGQLGVVVEVGSKGRVTADAATSVQYSVQYDYSGGNATHVAFVHAGEYFPVRPALNETVVKAMYSAPSADDWVKAAGIKLPRVVNQQAQVSVVPMLQAQGQQAQTGAAFEALRRLAAQCAKTDDYGSRLHSLARIVCHTITMSTMRQTPVETPEMRWENMTSLLSADTPNLQANELRNLNFYYIHTDVTAEYRAFLAMGARGLDRYVTARTATCYSACVTEPEMLAHDVLAFVRVGGEMQPQDVPPPPAAYTTVLANPAIALAFYYAYARSMGIGPTATAVLIQTAVAPHVWGAKAASIYKNCRPKLDACRYAVAVQEEDAHCSVYSAQQLVYQAAVIGAAAKVGLGGLLTAFKSSTATDGAAVLEKNIRRVNEAGAGREYMRAIHQHLQGGEAGLAWLTPLSFDMEDGLQECIRAYKNDAVLLSLFATTPIMALKSCFSTGVDMHNAIFGHSVAMNSNEYAQLFVSQLAGGMSVTCLCEKATRQELSTLQPTVTRLREWQPVATFVRFCAGMTGTEMAHTSPPRDEPAEEAIRSVSSKSQSIAESTIDVPQPQVDIRRGERRATVESPSGHSQSGPDDLYAADGGGQRPRQKPVVSAQRATRRLESAAPVRQEDTVKVSWAAEVEGVDDAGSVETVRQASVIRGVRTGGVGDSNKRAAVPAETEPDTGVTQKVTTVTTTTTPTGGTQPIRRRFSSEPHAVTSNSAHQLRATEPQPGVIATRPRTMLVPLTENKRSGVVGRSALVSPAAEIAAIQRGAQIAVTMPSPATAPPRSRRIEQVNTTDASLVTRSKTEVAEVEDESVTLDGLSI